MPAPPNEYPEFPLYLGLFRQGDVIPLCLHAVRSDGLVEQPTLHPVVSIYKPDGTLLLRAAMPADEQGPTDGFFRLGQRVTSAFAAGTYVAHFCWKDTGGSAGGRVAHFTVIPGGAAVGEVAGLRLARRPHGNFLVRQRADGTFAKGKNPR